MSGKEKSKFPIESWFFSLFYTAEGVFFICFTLRFQIIYDRPIDRKAMCIVNVSKMKFDRVFSSLNDKSDSQSKPIPLRTDTVRDFRCPRVKFSSLPILLRRKYDRKIVFYK